MVFPIEVFPIQTEWFLIYVKWSDGRSRRSVNSVDERFY